MRTWPGPTAARALARDFLSRSSTDSGQWPVEAYVAEGQLVGVLEEYQLEPGFAARAQAHDADDSFVADNYQALLERQVVSAGLPAELGGGGATNA